MNCRLYDSFQMPSIYCNLWFETQFSRCRNKHWVGQYSDCRIHLNLCVIYQWYILLLKKWKKEDDTLQKWIIDLFVDFLILIWVLYHCVPSCNCWCIGVMKTFIYCLIKATERDFSMIPFFHVYYVVLLQCYELG